MSWQIVRRPCHPTHLRAAIIFLASLTLSIMAWEKYKKFKIFLNWFKSRYVNWLLISDHFILLRLFLVFGPNRVCQVKAPIGMYFNLPTVWFFFQFFFFFLFEADFEFLVSSMNKIYKKLTRSVCSRTINYYTFFLWIN